MFGCLFISQVVVYLGAAISDLILIACFLFRLFFFNPLPAAYRPCAYIFRIFFFSEGCFCAKTNKSSLVFVKKGYFLVYFLCS